MKRFEYLRPADPRVAVQAAAREGTSFIAGGTNLIDLMRAGVAAPETIVDISRLPLDRIEPDGPGLRIGALVRNSDLAAHLQVRARWPALARAIAAGASAQLRNQATTAGNLLQRTRCVYFLDPQFACNKRSLGSGCDALEGRNRHHAILGASDQCIATHPSDLAVAAVALDAAVEILAPSGERRHIPLEDLYRRPEADPRRETVLATGELITAMTLPRPLRGRQEYVKARDRASFAFALVSVAAALDVRQGRIFAARLALGGVAPFPWRVRAAETALLGLPPTRSAFEELADRVLSGAATRQENGYKVRLARRLIVGTMEELASRC